MKPITKVYISRWIAVFIAMGCLFGLMQIQKTVFNVTLKADASTLLVGSIFTCIGFGLAWVISSIWKQTKDIRLHEMGIIELKVLEAVVKQTINARERADVDGAPE